MIQFRLTGEITISQELYDKYPEVFEKDVKVSIVDENGLKFILFDDIDVKIPAPPEVLQHISTQMTELINTKSDLPS